ncbi:adenylate kinase [Halobacteriales archaeon QS_5_70_17]|nr:MAG: adenylate kinase [Halobacteriales archaeon QS_5_70_17]
MRVAVTGTPGTGKTTVTDRLAEEAGVELEVEADVVHLNEVIREEGFHDGADPERGSLYADLEAVADWLDAREDAGERGRTVVVESHLAHRLPADRVVVLRCHPDLLRERLRERGEDATTAQENAEAEALDVLLSETVERHDPADVYEIDTTDRPPAAVADDVAAAVAGERAPSAGAVDFTDWL